MISMIRRMRSAGQSLLEYAMLTGLVAAGVTAMYTYVQRAVNANLQNLQEEINASVDDTNQTTEPEEPTTPGPGTGDPDPADPGPGDRGGGDPIVY